MDKLSNIPFLPILDTSSGDIIRDFFNPALAASVRYDRGVGFFSASWLRLAAKGMTEFAANSGRARWVTSPILGEADWEALQEGSEARQDEVLMAGVGSVRRRLLRRCYVSWFSSGRVKIQCGNVRRFIPG